MDALWDETCGAVGQLDDDALAAVQAEGEP